MAVIRISDSTSWSAASWVFENALEGVVSLLSTEDCLKNKIEVSLKDGSNYFDLGNLSKGEFQRFSEKVTELIHITRHQGKASFNSPEFYEAYVVKLGEFNTLVEEEVSTKNDAQPT